MNEIIKQLNEIALEANWGTVDRIDGKPKAIVVIVNAINEITRLENELAQTKRSKKMDKEKEVNILMDINDIFADIAFNLYKVGYRKADEVRKETAREISNWLHEHSCYEEHYQLVDLFDEVFGVEVDE